jgi:hypothetical protein
MDGQAGLVSIKVTCGFNFFIRKEKRVAPFFSFIFFLCFFLLRVWFGYLFFRACHDASLAKREVAIGVLGGTAVV